MSDQKTGLFPKALVDGFVSLLSPLINISTRLNISPNFFTILGFLITVVGAAILIWRPDQINLVGLIILLGGVCDVIDGKLARNSNKVTKFGALLDSTIDRYTEVAMFFGIAAYYVKGDHYLLSVVTFAALGGSTMVSYVRARAEGLGFEAKVGLMQRPERVVSIGAGALFHYPLFSITMFYVTDFPVTLMEIAIWAVAILANVTAIQRIMHIYRDTHKKQEA
ncbi:MAG: CDP-alcohol phosphatidyltransferase family protein [Calditrichae bacterium]|nr:CDP-alcohol phosphatidyltransferase family protein [Calditrichota bacterium]MCB9059702.1 CDP-alcohol phosphatidyltransferase family protein [Calditrichia bacterium]